MAGPTLSCLALGCLAGHPSLSRDSMHHFLASSHHLANLAAEPGAPTILPACACVPPQQVHTVLPYHIRVIIPCYKEPLDVIQKTVTAALVAPIPAGCTRTGEWAGKGPLRQGPRGPVTAGCWPAFLTARTCQHSFNRHGRHGACACNWYVPLSRVTSARVHGRPLRSFPPAVYLLDDGRDIDKKKFMRGLGVTNAVYVRCALAWRGGWGGVGGM